MMAHADEDPVAEQLAALLRRRIRDGDPPTGAALPAQPRLMRQYRCGAWTVQRALDLLDEDGWIVRHPRRATRVTRPPRRWLVLFDARPDEASSGRWTGFYERIAALAPPAAARAGMVVEQCSIAAGSPAEAARLIAAARRGRWQAAFVACEEVFLPEAVAGLRAALPTLVVAHASGAHPVLRLDHLAIIAAAVDQAAKGGWRRVAAIIHRYRDRTWEEALSHRRVSCPEPWRLEVDLAHPADLRRLIGLLAGQRHPPDGLLVLNDTLLPRVRSALDDAGWRIPLIAHANLPVEHLPGTARVGFDLVAALKAVAQAAAMGRFPAVIDASVSLLSPQR